MRQTVLIPTLIAAAMVIANHPRTDVGAIASDDTASRLLANRSEDDQARIAQPTGRSTPDTDELQILLFGTVLVGLGVVLRRPRPNEPVGEQSMPATAPARPVLLAASTTRLRSRP